MTDLAPISRSTPAASKHLAYPLRLDFAGRLATASDDDRVPGMIEQVLFTLPGERVARPSFGCDLRAATLGRAIEAGAVEALRRWLSDKIEVERVGVEYDELTFSLVVQYVDRRSQQRQIVSFSRQIP